MRLSELALACFLYTQFTDYDDSYISFLQATNKRPDLFNPKHRKALLIWLNRWGCRQFAIEYHELASSEILSFYNEFNAGFFDRDKNLWELTEHEVNFAAKAYEALSNKRASLRRTKGNTFPVSVGPTGAAKILFAIRPNALVPWDDAIRVRLGYKGFQISYLSFLKKIRSMLVDLSKSCQSSGFQLTDLPEQLGRPNSTVPKLIDEYYWVTITNNCTLPVSETFQRWANWSRL